MPKSEGFEEMKSESINSFLQLSLDAIASSSLNVEGPGNYFPSILLEIGNHRS